MSNNLVAAFNALQQSQKIGPEGAPNDWHFELRFLRRMLKPVLCLLILQPESGFTRILNLPHGGDTLSTGLEYFPDTPQDAAPEIVKVLLDFFVTDGPLGDMAPWKLTTRFKTLACAVGVELKQQGVCPPPLCDVGVASKKGNEIADARSNDVFNGIWEGRDQLRSIDKALFPKPVFLLNKAPQPPIPGDYKKFEGAARYKRMAWHYGTMLARGTPPDGGPYHGRQSLVKEQKILNDIQSRLTDFSADAVKSTADNGDADAAVDYGVRLSLGLGCEPNRKLSRVYFMKAANSTTASSKTKATAHGLLVFWCCDASITETVPIHFIYAACHHANEAATLCKLASPPNSPSSPAVIWLLDTVFDQEINPAFKTPSDMTWTYVALFNVDKEREHRYRGLDAALQQKKHERDYEYFCAAIDCKIQTDFPRILFKCGGKCDEDKKARYCSAECQKADWPDHKPSCRPGAPSDLKYTWPMLLSYGDLKKPNLKLLIRRVPDGPNTVLASHTLTATQLKALEPFSTNVARFKIPKGYGEWLE